jgi:hypothetical protein
MLKGLIKMPQIVSEIIIVGSEKAGSREKMQVMLDDLPPHAIPTRIASLDEAVLQSDAMLLVTSSDGALPIDLSQATNRVLLLDIAKPANAPPEINAGASHHLAVAGSLVQLPGSGRGFGRSLGLDQGNVTFGCCGEGVVMALVYDKYRKGDSTLWNALTADVAEKDIPTLFTAMPNAVVMERMGHLARALGIGPVQGYIDPHTNQTIPEARVNRYLKGG